MSKSFLSRSESETVIAAPCRQRRGASAASKRKPHAVIIVENMTVPPDRRVWQQAKALRDSDWRVTVITPKVGSYQTTYETIDGIDIVRHDIWIEARRIESYALEYSSALVGQLWALLKIGPSDIDVIQICNPPDFLFAPAWIAQKIGGAKIVFDHHDLTPELLMEKTGRTSGFLLALARWAERKTFAVAEKVISTNASFGERAIVKGGKAVTDVSVVYSSPDSEHAMEGVVTPSLKCGKKHLLLWVGMLGSQDGVDLLLSAMQHLKNLPGGADAHLLIAGSGPEKPHLEALASKLGIDKDVTFAGFLTGQDFADAFATADIGVGSDPKNPFNDKLAMNKVMEYMAYGLPMVMFDLEECRYIADDAALYASGNDPKALAARISNLLEAPAVRQKMGRRAFERLSSHFSWEQQKKRYLNVYRSLI